MNLSKSIWFGCLQVFKPKKNQSIGVPYQSWHHFAIIDDKVIVYIWDTREIVNVYNASSVLFGNFEFETVTDNGEQLYCGKNTPKQVVEIVNELCNKYPHIPILSDNEIDDRQEIKKLATKLLKSIDKEIFNPQDDAKIIFIAKDLKLPEDMLMYTEVDTLNPKKRKFSDMTLYTGKRKYFGIIARCDLLNSIKELNK